MFRCEEVNEKEKTLCGTSFFLRSGCSRFYLAMPFVYCLTTDCEITILALPDVKDSVIVQASDVVAPLTLGDFMTNFSRFSDMVYKYE